MPKEISTGACGAIGKAVLFYGKDRMENFCNAIKNCEFNGVDDPAHVLWLWLTRTSRDTKDVYKRTAKAIRCYINCRKLSNRNFEPCKIDIFEWNEDYTEMVVPKQKNQFTRV